MLNPRILLYRGISAGSRLIRWMNWSDYSHAAWEDGDGAVYEAWIGSGVREVKSLHDQHTPGTTVDVFQVAMTFQEEAAVRNFIAAQVGKPYDLRGVLHFASRRPEQPKDQTRWFCSELIYAAHAAAGVHLLQRIPAWKVYPGLLAYSPLLMYVGSTVVDSRSADRHGPRDDTFGLNIYGDSATA
jgi:uncharacterized protein YycO